MLIIVDYSTGNLGSVQNMLKQLGQVDVAVSSDPADIRKADRLILPGVGHFSMGMANLRKLGLVEPIRERALEAEVPLLGICLGMQLLFEGSDEGEGEGLRLILGRCVRFRPELSSGIKVPHMGWNDVTPVPGRRMFRGQPEAPCFYFVHSYYAQCSDPEDVSGWTTHGVRFASAVERGCVWGTQFHPEKSHRYGLALLAQFVEGR